MSTKPCQSLSRLQRELERSRAKLVELEASKKRLRDLDRQIQEERNRNRELQLQVDAHNAKLMAINTNIDELERDFELEKRLVQALKEELQSKETEIETMKHDHQSNLKLIQLLTSDLQLALDLQSELKVDSSQALEEAEELQALVETTEGKRQRQVGDLKEEQKAQDTKLRHETQLRDVAKEKLLRATDQIKGLESEHVRLMSENDSLRGQLTSTETELSELRDKYTRHRSILEHNLEQAETEIARIDDIHTDSVKYTLEVLSGIDVGLLSNLPGLRILKHRLEEELEESGKIGGPNCSIESDKESETTKP